MFREDTELASNPSSRHAWRLLLVLFVAGVAWLAFMPHPPPRATTGWDKANHAIAFCAMAFAALRGFPAAPAAVPAWLAGYGVAIEIVQSFIPGRSADPLDLVADAVGIAIGALLVHGWRRWMRG